MRHNLRQAPGQKPDTRRGFTIVELLIVIVIIAILATIVIVAYNGLQTRAAAATLKSDLKSSATQLGLDNVNDGTYPATVAAANNGAGLKASSGTNYQYTQTSTSYCLSATSAKAGSTAFNISSTSGTVADGVCAGHAVGGSDGGGGVVTTLAGSTLGFADGAGSAAQFNYPSGVAVDSSGTVYVADIYNSRIRKISSAGVVTTLAGSGTAGFADGTGSIAQFNYPLGIAVDSSGTVYVGDYYNHRIRKITPAGAVTTLAGSTAGFADGTGSAAQFNYPFGVAVDSSGTVYVGDSGNQRIRKITPAGVVTTLAGSGTAGFADGTGSAAQFYNPSGVAVDPSGTVYVADRYNQRIRKITPAGVVTTLAGSGTAGFADGTSSAAQFNYPEGVAVGSSGTVYVGDSSNHRIRKITSSGVVTTLAGSGIADFADGTGSSAQFSSPQGVAVDSSGTVYVADTNNHRIRKVE